MARKSIIALTLVWALTAVPSAHATAEEHCAVRITGKKASGEFTTTKPECRPSYAAALEAVGVSGADSLDAGATDTQLRDFAAAADATIGTHYDAFGLTGSSFSVVGSDCTGGYVNLSSTWDNKVSSTANGCNRVRHWDGDNKTGPWQDTTGAGGNLSTLNNKANSIQYLT